MKITYITHHGVAERIKFIPESTDVLELEFIPTHDGMVTLGGMMLKLKGGSVSLRLDTLPDGEYIPRIDAEDGTFIAEGFVKCGKEITLLRNDEEVTSRLLQRALALEERCEKMSKRLAELHGACRGHNIFNF